MLKKNTSHNRLGMTYNLTSIEERIRIMELKRLGKKSKEIAQIMNKKIKSIESIKRIERQSQYKEFKQKVIQYGLKLSQQQIDPDIMNKKKIIKKVRIIINQILNHNDEFRLLIPISRQSSNQRRIKDSIVQIVTYHLLSNKNTSDDNKQQINDKNEIYIQHIKKNIEKQQFSNSNQESSKEEIDIDDYQNYFTIDLVTPQHLNLEMKKINFFQQYQRFSEINQLEDSTTTYENNNEKFKQLVDKSSQTHEFGL
ncbi:unnamed protein product [Paramecium sonneborni]|uniref:Uncharacterized protein n=1 Tax=Paramecium sonneborni TaxID=65129 RepID=A0A8S1LLY0_9CILI|nr:unnamed protein product [Paramecium sonneborni]